MELLGKAGGALGAAIAAGFRARRGRREMRWPNDTVRRLADAQQAWENLGNKVVVVTGDDDRGDRESGAGGHDRRGAGSPRSPGRP